MQPEHPHTTEIRQRVRALESTSSSNKIIIAQRLDSNLAEETGQLRQEEGGAAESVRCDAHPTSRQCGPWLTQYSFVPVSRMYTVCEVEEEEEEEEEEDRERKQKNTSRHQYLESF